MYEKQSVDLIFPLNVKSKSKGSQQPSQSKPSLEKSASTEMSFGNYL